MIIKIVKEIIVLIRRIEHNKIINIGEAHVDPRKIPLQLVFYPGKNVWKLSCK